MYYATNFRYQQLSESSETDIRYNPLLSTSVTNFMLLPSVNIFCYKLLLFKDL